MTSPTVTLDRTFVAELLIVLRSTGQLLIALESQRAALEMRAYTVDRATSLTRETIQVRAELEQRLAEAPCE